MRERPRPRRGGVAGSSTSPACSGSSPWRPAWRTPWPTSTPAHPRTPPDRHGPGDGVEGAAVLLCGSADYLRPAARATVSPPATSAAEEAPRAQLQGGDRRPSTGGGRVAAGPGRPTPPRRPRDASGVGPARPTAGGAAGLLDRPGRRAADGSAGRPGSRPGRGRRDPRAGASPLARPAGAPPGLLRAHAGAAGGAADGPLCGGHRPGRGHPRPRRRRPRQRRGRPGAAGRPRPLPGVLCRRPGPVADRRARPTGDQPAGRALPLLAGVARPARRGRGPDAGGRSRARPAAALPAGVLPAGRVARLVEPSRAR
jgi:hypothetical protein